MISVCLSLLLACLLVRPAAGGVLLELTDFETWSTQSGGFQTIDFTGFDDLTPITDQYRDLGVTFAPGPVVVCCSFETFPRDGAGLSFGDAGITVSLDGTATALGVHHPGLITIDFFLDGELIARSSEFGGSGGGFFAGIVSDVPFDQFVIFDRFGGGGAIDDLHVGTIVPGPAAWSLLILHAAGGRRRRRPRATRRGR